MERELNRGRRTPSGGFCFVPAMGLIGAWWAYKRRIIRLVDLRVWLACFEVLARRCVAKRGVRAHFTLSELGPLVGGVGDRAVASAIRRLERAGLLRWADSAVTHGTDVHCEDAARADFLSTLAKVTNHRRLVPIPRRVIRYLAAETRPVLIATGLGHCLRCLYYRRGVCEPYGTCKASWVADVFEVDLRNVKAARGALVSLGLLIPQPCSQFRLNRWGLPVVVNLAWKATGDASESPPLGTETSTETPPPNRNRELSSRFENQKLPPKALGAQRAREGRGRPDLRRIRREDLGDTERLRALFRQAAKCRLVLDTECDRLRFLGAAEHARAIGKNPAALFAAMVRRGLWRFITHADEDRARRRLLAFVEPSDGKAQTVVQASKGRRLDPASEDPLEVRRLIAQSLAQAEELAVGQACSVHERAA